MSECSQLHKAEFIINNKGGLHARPGSALVSLTKKFESAITITNLTAEGSPVDAKNLLKVMASTIKCGNKVLVTAEGSDAEQAIASIGEAIAQGLGE